MPNVSVKITDKPSNSKGWGRYRLVDAAGAPVVKSRTGNEWLSSDQTAELEVGTTLTLTLQCQLVEGKRRTKTTYTEHHTLTVTADGVEAIQYRPGSQGISVTIAGVAL